MIIKEIINISDDETVENLMLDPRYQYAFHTTGYEEQLLNNKSLSRFRKRCYDYESVYDIDLLLNRITGLSAKITKMMNLNPRIKRMDSLIGGMKHYYDPNDFNRTFYYSGSSDADVRLKTAVKQSSINMSVR